MADRIAVFGAGGHGKVVADIALASGRRVVAFIDDEPSRHGGRIWDVPVVSWERFTGEAGPWSGAAVAMAIGSNAAREACTARVRSGGVSLATLVHPSAVVARSARIGEATVVMATAVVNPDAVVGEGSIVNTGAVVEHDCVLGEFVHLSPNAALGGGVHVGPRTHLGLGAVVLPLVRVGADVRVGAGAVVHRAVDDGLTVAGVPARPLPAPATVPGGTPVGDDVASYIAAHLRASREELGSALERVARHAARSDQPVTVTLAQAVLGDLLTKDRP